MREGPYGDGEPAVLARGTVLVDSRAAVDKLRAYQLIEPVYYVLELVRMAVLSGATAIDVYNDSDDLILTFDGEPLPATELTRVLDHLFSATDRRLRLLAVAVNTALGLRPSFVDLYTTHDAPPGKMARVRWTPRHYPSDAAAPTDDNAAAPTIAWVAAVPATLARGMRVHVRERFGLATVREAFDDEPAEAALLRTHSAELPVPLTRGGVRLASGAPQPQPLVEVALEPLGDLRGTLALMAPGARCDTLEFFELGVLLERRTLRGAVLPAGIAALTAPLWMRVAGDELPTNASRSRVTLEGVFGETMALLWDTALRKLIAAAAAAVALGGPRAEPIREALCTLASIARETERVPEVRGPAAPAPSPKATVSEAPAWSARMAPPPDDDVDALLDDLRGASSSVLARDAAPVEYVDATLCPPEAARPTPAPAAPSGARYAGDPLDAVLDAPLIPLINGTWLSPRVLAAKRAGTVYLGRHATPVEPALVPWLPDVVSLPDAPSPLATLVQSFRLPSAEGVFAEARAALARYERLVAHPPREPRLPADPRDVLRVAFGQASLGAGTGAPCLAVAVPDGVVGEMVVRRVPVNGAGKLRVTTYFAGRPLATERLGPARLVIEVALQAPALRARAAFDGVLRDEAFLRALAVPLEALIEAVAFAAEVVAQPSRAARDDARRAWLGAGFGALRAGEHAALAQGALALPVNAADSVERRRAALWPLLQRYRGLALARAWPTTQPERYISTAALHAIAQRPPHVLWVAVPGTVGARRDAQDVLALSPAQREVLRPLLPDIARWVEYGAFLPARTTSVLSALLLPARAARHRVASLALEGPGVRMIAAPAGVQGAVSVAHSGRFVAEWPQREGFAGLDVALEDDGWVPSAGLPPSSADLSAPARALLTAAGYDLAWALACALRGDREAAAALGVSVGESAPADVTRYLLTTLVNLPRDAADGGHVRRGARFPVTDAGLRAILADTPFLVVCGAAGTTSACGLRHVVARGARGPVPYVLDVPSDVNPDVGALEPLLLPDVATAGLLASATGVRLEALATASFARRQFVASSEAPSQVRFDELPPASDDWAHDLASLLESSASAATPEAPRELQYVPRVVVLGEPADAPSPELVTPEAPSPEWPRAEALVPVASAAPQPSHEVLKLLWTLGLSPDAVERVVLAAGRARGLLDFDAKSRVVTLHGSDDTVAGLLGEDTSRARLALGLTVVGEVNRALTSVTDADEERILEAALDSLAPRG